MSNNLENDRSVTTSKMYPMDLAPQKITIVKSVPNSDVKMTHLIPGQPKTTGPSQIITHTGPLGLMRPSTQIMSSSVSSQPHMIVSNSPLLAGTQIVSQGSQGIGQNTQIISQSQLIGQGQLVGPGTQIISQGTQLNASSGAGNTGGNLVSVSTSGPVLNVGGQLVSGAGNLVVSSPVRTLPPSVRVLPPLQHHNARPVLSNVSLNNSSLGGPGASVMVSKTVSSHVSHVPRGLAAGASLAIPRASARPVAPVSQALPISSLGTAWSSAGRNVRGAVVYSARPPRPPLAPGPPLTPRSSAPAPLPPNVTSPAPAHTPLSAIVTVPSTSVLASTGVITSGVCSAARVLSRPPAPAQRPVPLVQRNYQPTKLLGVANVVRPVGNSAPSQLYYEVSRPAPAQSPQRPLAPFHQLPTNNQVNVLNVRLSPENRQTPATGQAAVLPRPSILRKRDLDGSPTKNTGYSHGYSPPRGNDSSWEPGRQSPAQQLICPPDNDTGGGGSTTESAASSPAPDDEPLSPMQSQSQLQLQSQSQLQLQLQPQVQSQRLVERPVEPEISPRKKPRKQVLSSVSSDVRECEFASEETPDTPPPVAAKPPKRPQLSSTYVCGWRATALHFVRPSDVRRREARPRDILAIANQKHVLATAEGWKVHHLTAQMDDLVSLEADVSEQLSGLLRTLETAHGKAQAALAPHSHALLELVKGNIQRSRIVCEGVQEAREDILRVFTHRTFVSDILSRQADKRCFRKHRSQS